MAKIHSIVIQPAGRRFTGSSGKFLRMPADSAELLADHGIRGDQKAGKSKTRQLNIITSGWLAEAALAGYRTRPGEFGEQVIIDGIDMSELKPGLRLAFGDQAVIEITKPRTGCSRLEAAQGKAITPEMKAAVGYMARVVTGGFIRTGDDVRTAEALRST